VVDSAAISQAIGALLFATKKRRINWRGGFFRPESSSCGEYAMS
jgi:hypothetical protein